MLGSVWPGQHGVQVQESYAWAAPVRCRDWNVSKWDRTRHIGMYAFGDCTKPAATTMLFLWKALVKVQLTMT